MPVASIQFGVGEASPCNTIGREGEADTCSEDGTESRYLGDGSFSSLPLNAALFPSHSQIFGGTTEERGLAPSSLPSPILYPNK